ncbi:AEC family transporter [Facklamia sp. 7083-14-GEN3]|uniref:AEC family transporter n=1 Tax=Facklamia sp. 7083-14-GEN3 TaxID=2973478 RepID=UPI00215BF4A9|nr:AEC family transporter [Facklamia sp. 7083-14-GEN3]MCR8968616.1 AEC family transporter [Facklamia sp. 7083-14-GEN3]
MDLAIIIFQQLIILISIAMIGFWLVKKDHFSQNTVSQINKVIVKYLTPLIIIEAFFKPIESELIIQLLLAMIIYTIFLLIRIYVGHWYFGLNENGVAKFATVFGNVGFIGIPLTLAVFDPSFVMITTGLFLITNFFSWTLGLKMISVKNQEPKVKFTARPILVAFLIGAMIQVTSLPIPSVLSKGIHQLNQVYSPLAMIILGAYFVDIAKVSDYLDWKLWQTAAIKLLIWPLINLFMLLLIPGLSFETFFILVMILAGPSAMMTALLSQLIGGDYLKGAKIVLLTTVGSLLTIPLILNLATWLYENYYLLGGFING